MLKYIHGDLLESAEGVIAHGCNAQGKMGSGIAKAIRDKYPDCFETYHYRYQNYGLELGGVVFYEGERITIANCITQNTYGYNRKVYVNYPAVMQSLSVVAAHTVDREHRSFGMPLLGAGLGGGDWKVIEQIVKGVSAAYEVNINVYVLDRVNYEVLTQ